MPANTTFVGPAAWTCSSGVCTAFGGNLAGGAGASITFIVRVDNPLPAGVSQIDNTAVVRASEGAGGNGSVTVPVIAAPNLQFSKSANVSVSEPGQLIVYSLQYTNSGNIEVVNVPLAESVPANTTFVAGAGTAGWSCADGAAAGSACTFSIASIPGGGATGTVLFAVRVNNPLPAGVTAINNTAVLSGNLPSTTNTPVATFVDLRIIKDTKVESAQPGDTVSYALTYENLGNIAATGVVVTETVPANTVFVASGSTAGWSCADGAAAGTVCTFAIGMLAGGGASGSLDFAVRIINPLPAGVSSIVNTARIGHDGGAGASSTVTTPVIAAPILLVVKTDGGVSTTPGATVVYTLTYRNDGDIAATGVTLVESVPDNSTFNAAASSPGWSCANGASAGSICSLSIGTLNGGGASGTARFAVTVNSPLLSGVTQLFNTVNINGEQGPGEGSSDDTPVIAAPDLSISKTDGRNAVQAGNVLTYVITINNTGNQEAVNVEITDTLPANVTYLGASNGGALNSGGQVLWSVASLPAGQSLTLQVVVRVNTPLPVGAAQLVNTVRVTDDGVNGPDATPGNNSASDTDTMADVPDLTLAKSDGGARVSPGGVVSYTLTINNLSNIGAASVTLTETVPAFSSIEFGLSSPGWICAGSGSAGATCTISIGALAGQSSVSRVFALRVADPLPLAW